MFTKRILSAILLLTLVVFSVADAQARNYVIPTCYGYGVVSSSAVVKPYISAYYPYAAPAWAYNGYYYNYYDVRPAVAPATMGAPVVPTWNGMYWYYSHNNHVAVSSCNLNMRAEPYKSGNKNIIGSLKTGEQAYVLGQYGNWYLVQSLLAPLRRGYVYGPYLRFYGNAAPYGYYNVMHPGSLIRTAMW